MENTLVKSRAKFLEDHYSQEALPFAYKKSSSTRSNNSKTSSNLAFNSVISELERKGRVPPPVLTKPAIPQILRQKAQSSQTNGIIHCVNPGTSPEAPNELSDLNDKCKVDSMKCKKIFRQTITITDEDVKYENMKQSFRRLPDATWPPVPPSTTQAAGSSSKVHYEVEVKQSFHPLPNSTGTSSYPSRTKGSSPEARKHSSSNATRKPEIMRKPKIIQAGVAVLPPSPPQEAIPESTSVSEETYETADLNMTKEWDPSLVRNHDVNIIKRAVLSPSSSRATIPESTSIREETYETADINMAKESEQALDRNNDASSNKSSYFSDNSLLAQGKESVIADESSEAQMNLPEMQVIKPGRRQKKINADLRNAPRLKSLPAIDSLTPPKKPPRPPNVDLSRFLYLHGNNSIQFTGSPEAEKTEAVLSTETYEASISLSEVPAYDDTLDQESPGTRTCDYIASTDGNEFYQDIMPLSPYSDNVFDDNPDSGFCSPEVHTNHLDEQQYRSEYVDEVEYVNSPDASKKKPKPKDGKIDKKQLDFRKKYKISGMEHALYSTTINEDCKGGKDMLSLKKGDIIAIIQIMNCPMGQWLAKNEEGNYGFIPVSSVNGREHLIYINQSVQDSEYDDVGHSRERGTSLGGSSTSDAYADMSLDNCDVTSIKSTGSGKRKVLAQFFKKDKEKSKEKHPRESTGKSTSSATDSYCEFPIDNDFYATTITEDDKKGAKQEKTKKLSKQEREFRVKFKYTKDIDVLNIAVVTESAPRSAKTKFDLSVKPGEQLEVIDTTDENKVICRNAAGKYGHVAIEHLHFTYNVFS